MNLKTAAGVTAAYGLWVIAGGVWRYLEAASANALGFGLFMGVLALVGAGLLLKGMRTLGLIVTALAVVFVGGFFATKGSKDGIDIRVAITLVFSAAEAAVVVLAWRGKKE